MERIIIVIVLTQEATKPTIVSSVYLHNISNQNFFSIISGGTGNPDQSSGVRTTIAETIEAGAEMFVVLRAYLRGYMLMFSHHTDDDRGWMEPREDVDREIINLLHGCTPPKHIPNVKPKRITRDGLQRRI